MVVWAIIIQKSKREIPEGLINSIWASQPLALFLELSET